MAFRSQAPWQNARILSTLVLVFLAGAASGALWMRLLHDHQARATASVAKERKAALVAKFKSQLDLSDTQSEKIASILDDYSQYYQSLQDQLDDIRATGKTRILQILDPVQRNKFNALVNNLAPELETPPAESK